MTRKRTLRTPTTSPIHEPGAFRCLLACRIRAMMPPPTATGAKAIEENYNHVGCARQQIAVCRSKGLWEVGARHTRKPGSKRDRFAQRQQQYLKEVPARRIERKCHFPDRYLILSCSVPLGCTPYNPVDKIPVCVNLRCNLAPQSPNATAAALGSTPPAASSRNPARARHASTSS